ncbi:MAG: hypothetical protein LBE56_09740 [Tannerella sp.]|jgi:hypothetical protein|nr:hypothetical protein [Tannerella sp.]
MTIISSKKLSVKVLLLAMSFFTIGIVAQTEKYSIVVDPAVGQKVEYGLGRFEEALKAKGILSERVDNLGSATGRQIVVAGLSTGNGVLAQIARTGNRAIPGVAEALGIWKETYDGKPLLALGGFDDQGVMYALLEAALKTEWGSKRNPFEFIYENVEKPDIAVRAISMYTMHRVVWERKLYDRKYWEKYFNMLSQNRFNSFVIIFGYENGGFLAPPYPYFFDVPGYPDVRMVGLTKEQQKRNLTALNEVIDMAHQRGIKVTLGIWDHIYRGGVQAGGTSGWQNALNQPTEHLVWGVTGDNLLAYTKDALAAFVEHFPKVDGIEFRMHNESGLRNDEQEAFWKDVFKSLKATAPHIRYMLRAKEMPETVVQAALDEKILFQIETKYWMEQMGMPWHPAHINTENQMERRHGYADMLRYPQDYKVYWRLWTGGTARMLLWGSPEYARRFIESAKLYDGDSYDVLEPLATKMVTRPHDDEPFELLNPAYKYYEYEFERYWHYYQVFGRIGYNLGQSPDIWNHEFEKRFGRAATYLQQAMHQASWVLPRIVASCYPYQAFPTTRGWAEKQPFGRLSRYATIEGTDVQVFASFDEEAKLLIEHGETAKLLPSVNSARLKEISDQINELVQKAENGAGKSQSNEFKSTVNDLKILSNLALYHSRRIPAAVNYRLFERTKDVAALDRAIEHEKNAIQAWSQIVDAAGDVYSKTLDFGVEGSMSSSLRLDIRGHWSDELTYLETGLEELVKQRASLTSVNDTIKAPEYQASPRSDNNVLFQVDLDMIEKSPVNKALTIRAKVTGVNGVKWVRLRHRPVNQMIEYKTLRMVPTSVADIFEATIPVQDINPRFDLMYFIEVMDNNGNGKIYPDMNLQTPYVFVKLDFK